MRCGRQLHALVRPLNIPWPVGTAIRPMRCPHTTIKGQFLFGLALHRRAVRILGLEPVGSFYRMARGQRARALPPLGCRTSLKLLWHCSPCFPDGPIVRMPVREPFYGIPFAGGLPMLY